jgi:hypothetical protein
VVVPELFHAGLDQLFCFSWANNRTRFEFAVAQFVVIDKELDVSPRTHRLIKKPRRFQISGRT